MNRSGAERLLAALAWLCVLVAAAARAQITVDDVQFGWDKRSGVNRWFPITLRVTGGPAGYSGTVRIEYRQDPTQRATLSAPIAATPNTSSVVMVPVCFAGTMDPVRITIGGAGGVDFDETYSASPGARRKYLDVQLLNGVGMVLLIGEGSFAELAKQLPEPAPMQTTTLSTPLGTTTYNIGSQPTVEQADSPERRELRWKRTTFAQRSVTELPTDAQLYDTFEFIVLGEGATPLGTREAAALRRWVNAGGWLVIHAGPGEGWRRWVESADGESPIELTPFEKSAVPAELAGLFKSGENAVRAAASVNGRKIRAAGNAQSMGWSVRWSETGQEGLLAEGPVGLGMVTVLGVDPRGVSEVISSAAMRAVWRDGLAGPLGPMMLRAPDYSNSWGFMVANSPGATAEQNQAITNALDKVAIQPKVGLGIFLGIAIGMTLLTLLIGPVDAIGLKILNLRHRSWLTALGWIGIGCLGAYLLPLLFRSGESNVATYSIVDAVLRADGTSEAARRATVIGLYAQRSARFDLLDPAARANDESWTRGVAASTAGRNSIAFAPLPLLVAQGSASRSCVPLPMTVPQWTFRTLLQEAETSAPSAIATIDAGGQVQVEVRGLPEGATIGQAHLAYQGRECDMLYAATPGTAGVFMLDTAKSKWTPSLPFSAEELATKNIVLPGADRRSIAIAARQRDQGCAILTLEVEGVPAAVPAKVSAGVVKNSGKALYRLTLPLARLADEAGEKP